VGSRAPDLHYIPYGELAGEPSVVVDGAPAPGTVLCLSHWPGVGSPPEFAADLSADMAFLYVDAFDRHGEARLASNNHYDQDGLVGLFALVRPDQALARRDLLVEVARAGDFAVTSSRDAARISMVLSAYADPKRSPLSSLPAQYEDMTAALYGELLGRLCEICDNPDRFRDLWAEEDESLRSSEAALASGAVTIAEIPDLDLAIVRASAQTPDEGGHRFAGRWAPGLHPMAVNNATERGALLTVRGHVYDFGYRYESWVQFRSRTIRPRVDLSPLADRLNTAEAAAGGGAHWVAEPVSALTPSVSTVERAESCLAPSAVIDVVEKHLRSAPPAWDPYRITR
jgi:hypothetical protein